MSIDQISTTLADIYDAPKNDIEADVSAFLTDLANKKLLERVDG